MRSHTIVVIVVFAWRIVSYWFRTIVVRFDIVVRFVVCTPFDPKSVSGTFARSYVSRSFCR